MKSLKISILVFIILIIISVVLYNINYSSTSYNIRKYSINYCVPFPSTDPMLYLTNKALVCYYNNWNNVSGGKFKDAFDMIFMNEQHFVDPTGIFSFELTWNGSDVKYNILAVNGVGLAKYVKEVLNKIQAAGFRDNANFKIRVTVNYRSKSINIVVLDFKNISPVSDGLVEMYDILPVRPYKLIPYLPRNAYANYQNLNNFPKLAKVMSLVEPTD